MPLDAFGPFMLHFRTIFRIPCIGILEPLWITDPQLILTMLVNAARVTRPNVAQLGHNSYPYQPKRPIDFRGAGESKNFLPDTVQLFEVQKDGLPCASLAACPPKMPVLSNFDGIRLGPLMGWNWWQLFFLRLHSHPLL